MSGKRSLPSLFVSLSTIWDMDQTYRLIPTFRFWRWNKRRDSFLLFVRAKKRDRQLTNEEANSLYSLPIYDPVGPLHPDTALLELQAALEGARSAGYDEGWKDGYEDGVEDRP